MLDNAEHLVEPVARLAMAALSAAPALRVLVTSQAPLRLERERIFRLSALRVPAEDEPFDEVASAPSVALFADRAQAADHRFALTPANLSRVVGLCRRLDGLPLALRLAAGRVHLLGLSGLEAHMEDRLQWLAGETRDAPTRQQTLAAAIDWSYSLLAAPEQRLYRRLGVFVGGFTAEIAGALGGGTAADLQGLVERSMVDVELREPPRLRLLESQREHALRELARAGEIGDLRAHHARAIGEAMQAAARAYWSTPDATWLPMWAPELDNVRAALKWSEQHDRALCALLVGVSAPMFRLMGLAAELRRQADRLGEMPDLESGAATAFWLARAHLESGRSGVDMCRFVQQAEKHARAADDRLLLYLALCQKGASLLGAGDAGLLDEIGALQAGDWPPRVLCQRFLAEFTVLSLQERWTRALQAARAGLALGLDAGATHPTSVFANWTIVALFCLGDLDAALEQSRQMHPHIAAGPAGSTIPYLGTCARIALNRGDVAGARQQLARMFDLCRSVEWMNFEVFGDLYAELALAEGRATEAARLLGFATSAGERAWGVARSSRTRDHIRGTLERLLGVTAVLRLASEGYHMDPESVCGAVLPHAEASHT